MTEPDVGAAPSYEQARDELIDVVRRLEAGGATLEESLALWERGEELAAVCGRWLEGARARLDAALQRDGSGAGGGGEADGPDGPDGREGQAAGDGEENRDGNGEAAAAERVIFPE